MYFFKVTLVVEWRVNYGEARAQDRPISSLPITVVKPREDGDLDSNDGSGNGLDGSSTY